MENVDTDLRLRTAQKFFKRGSHFVDVDTLIEHTHEKLQLSYGFSFVM
jgi:hypothetical protein